MPIDSVHLPLGHLPDTRYPDPRVEQLDKRFKRQGNAAIERIAHGFRWAEGPVYFRDGGYLLWSDIPNNRMMGWLEDDSHVSVFRAPSNYSNGNTRDREGRLITCEHDSRRVTRTDWVQATVLGVVSTTVYCSTCRKGWKQTRVRSLDPVEKHQIFGNQNLGD